MAKNSSKVIRGEEFGAAEQWAPPTMSGELASKGRGRDPIRPPTIGELEAIRKQAYEEGFSKGNEEGYKIGHNQGLEESRSAINALVSRFDEILHTLNTPLKQVDDEVEQELITLVIAMVKQLVRREVQLNPDQIIGVVREALGILPADARNIRLRLNPKDAELVHQIYSLDDTEVGWKIIEDPLMQMGGCTVETETSQIDATLESRLAKLIAPLIGGRKNEEDKL